MSNTINLIAFGTFGNPNGFKQSFFSGNTDGAPNVKTFDLKTDAIQLFPDSTVYSIRKENRGGHTAIAYTIYTYAKEQHSDRGGTFIGSSLLFTGKIADENLTLRLLNEFHKDLARKNVQNNIIMVNHSDNFSVSKPKDFDKIGFQLKDIEPLNFIGTADKNLVVYTETNTHRLQQLFRQSIDLLQVYDAIYFTSDEKIAEFVNRKAIFKFIQNVGDVKQFEEELAHLEEERKQKIETYIRDLETEKQKLEKNRKNVIENYKAQIEQNEKLHQENGLRIKNSKTDLEKLNQTYAAFLKKTDEFIQQLKSGKKPEQVKQTYHENQREFITTAGQYSTNSTIPTLSRPVTTDKRTEQRLFGYDDSYPQEEKPGRSHRKKADPTFKFLFLLTLLLWIGTLTYFLYFNKTIF
ncbi:hypothetical protein [Flavobacterium cerinum]|uniref:Uncharacterized protein n=1 Tax=Flavobacterium cerinum TaxID=2502784 RepID=A0ABY5IP67_9FLAO|nr:hypothetical protein [Flavobacterium cerinum]UUC44066.1 hypothetical protein NOX80_10525 [Flavobacterium cerinum]